MKAKVGYIGMGIMGRPMAANLMKAGFEVAVYNRTSSKTQALADAGAAVYGTPAELAAASDVIFTNVTDSPDVEAVVLGTGGVADGARPGAIVVDNSTISPDATQAIAAALAEKGVGFMDAPVSGGDIGAQQGTLTIMCGGEPEVFEQVKPMLEAMGKTITLMGPVGMGQVTKACNQIMCAVNMVACCEAISLAKRMGLDTHLMLKVVTAGAGGSWALENLGPKIADGDLDPGFMVRLIQKDLDIVIDAAKRSNLPLPGTALAHELFRAAQAAGLGDMGTQAMSAAYETLGNFKLTE